MTFFQPSDYLTADYADLADKAKNAFNYPLDPRNPRVIDDRTSTV